MEESKPAFDLSTKDLVRNEWGSIIVLTNGGDYVKSIFKLIVLTIAISAFAGVTQASETKLINLSADHNIQEVFPKGSVLSPVVRSNASQLVFLIVRDQNLNPVEGAASLLTVHFPNEVQNWLMPLTDEYGVSQLTLEIKNQPPGTSVLLHFRVVFEELEASTRDSFRVWW